HLVRIVNAADDDRLVRVAFLKSDDNFLTDPRPEKCSPAFTGPDLRDADPAGAVRVLLALSVPVELDLHAAVLVSEDFLTRRSDDDRGLRPLDKRPRCFSERAVR